MKLEEITVIVGPTDEALAAAINQTSVSRRARRSLGMATLMTGRPSGRGAVQRRSPDQSRNPEGFDGAGAASDWPSNSGQFDHH